jgi:hypothetical protein
MYFVAEVFVSPSTDAKFYEASKDEVLFWSKLKLPYPYSACVADDNRYYFLVPVADYADAGNFLKTMGEAATKAPAEYQALLGKFAGTYEYERYSIYTLTPELSYFPQKPRPAQGELNYIALDFWYIKPGKDQEFEKLLKEMLALMKKNNIADVYSAYIGAMGAELPVYVFTAMDKDEASFYAHNTEMWNILGKEGSDLIAKMTTLRRKSEWHNAWPLPEISYTPEAKKPAK